MLLSFSNPEPTRQTTDGTVFLNICLCLTGDQESRKITLKAIRDFLESIQHRRLVLNDETNRKIYLHDLLQAAEKAKEAQEHDAPLSKRVEGPRVDC